MNVLYHGQAATRRARRYVYSGAAICGILVVAFYLWTAQSPLVPFSVARHQLGYYDLLSRGLLTGHLSMKLDADPRLATLQDPYEPSESPEIPRLHDASYYKGKYYLYFGVAPALVWFVPWHLLTGHDISENLSDAVLSGLGYIFWSLLVLRIWRRFFGQLSAWIPVALILTLGLANMVPVMLRRAAFWEVPIAGAYFFNAVACYSVWRAIESSTRQRWLALASLAVGLSIGSRPGGICFAPGLVLLAVWLGKPEKARTWWQWRTLRFFAAAVTPVSLCIVLILIYNFERFGNLFEFGTSYQLAGHNMHKWRMMDAHNLWVNIYYYFLSTPQWSVYFPFFQVIGDIPVTVPKGYYGVENVYGVLPGMPFVLVGLMCVALPLNRRLRDLGALRLLSSVLLGGFLATLPILLIYAASASRYMVDFVPWLVALAVLGVLVGEGLFASRRLGRVCFRLVWCGTALWSLLFNVLVSFQHNELLRAHNPPVYARLAHLFNHLSPALELVSGSSHGPLEMDIKLPAGRSGKLEPLVVTGISFLADFVYIYYTDTTHIQLGFEHTGYGGKVSQPIPVDYSAVQHLRLEMGSLYPPASHPYFSGRSAPQVLDAKMHLKLWVNGVPYLDSNFQFYDSSPKNVTVGFDAIYGAFGRRFSGEILRSVRGPESPQSTTKFPRGEVKLAVRLPSDKIGQREPLIVTGETGRGDILYINYLAADSISLGLDHWGFGEVGSRPIKVNYDLIHVFMIDLGSLHNAPPGPLPPSGFPARYSVIMDGLAVLNGTANFHPATADQVYHLANPIGGSTTTTSFSGTIIVP